MQSKTKKKKERTVGKDGSVTLGCSTDGTAGLAGVAEASLGAIL